MKNDRVRQWVNIGAVLATIAVNGLANALPLNGLNTGEISDRFEVFFVPAGYVFSIWGAIYLGLIAFAVYQALPAQRENPQLRRIGYLFAVSCAANIAWLFLWHYEAFVLTLFAMLALLLTLIAIYVRLGIGLRKVGAAERWALQVPFSIYLGWITVATIANFTSVLDFVRWSGWGIGPELWAVIMLAAATVITAAVSLTRGDIDYVLVIVWASVGIGIKHSGTTLVAPAAYTTAVLVALSAVWGQVRQRAQAG